MAREVLTPLVLARGGISTTSAVMTAAVADGHMFANDGMTTIVFNNTNASPRTVTIQTPGNVDGLAIAELTITVPATNGRIYAGTFPRSVYNQTTGYVYVDYSATAGLTVAAIRIPREVLP